MRRGAIWTLALLCLSATWLWATPAEAIPAFARRFKADCQMCHGEHYPRLNEFGRRFRENGYNFPGAPPEKTPYQRDIPISFRGQFFGVAPIDADASGRPGYENKLYAFLLGGGPVAEDVSYFFSWTPFPDPDVHQARIGLHNLAEKLLGKGSLNLRAGALFLLDFQRPSHRFLAPGPVSAGGVAVGENGFTLDDSAVGIEVYGRPGYGSFLYELAVVAGDPGDEGVDRDGWKDVFGRMSYILFPGSGYQLTPGVFGYLGRSDIDTEIGGVQLSQRDDFWIAGGDLELELGFASLAGMVYLSRHGDALPDGRSVDFWAARSELSGRLTSWLIGSARFETVRSADLPELDRRQIAPHLTLLLASNVLLSFSWRHDLSRPSQADVVGVLDAAF